MKQSTSVIFLYFDSVASALLAKSLQTAMLLHVDFSFTLHQESWEHQYIVLLSNASKDAIFTLFLAGEIVILVSISPSISGFHEKTDHRSFQKFWNKIPPFLILHVTSVSRFLLNNTLQLK